MSYKRAEANFAEYQRAQGLGDEADSTRDLNSKGASNIAMKVTGYENYPSYYGSYDTLGENPKNISSIAQEVIEEGDVLDGLNLGDVQDDAFGGYTAPRLGLAESTSDEEDEEDSAAFDGYGPLGGTPLESFHTFFHKASMAKSPGKIKDMLAQAVKAVADDTPVSVKQEYYRLAKEMLKRRKNQDMRHLDLDEVEIQSNIGWLINPGLPKSGGFKAILNSSVGAVGAALGKGGKDDIKRKTEMAIGQRAFAEARKIKTLGDYSGLGSIPDSAKYVGIGLAGLAVVAIWYSMNKSKIVITSNKKKRKKKKK